MNKFRKMITMITAVVALTFTAVASPVYYTIFHALEDDSMERFNAGGSATLSVSLNGGESYATVSSFSFNKYGRAAAWIFPLNYVDGDAWIRLAATFNESDKGQPVDTVVISTVSEFLDSLDPYRGSSWVTYAPVYVSYELQPNIVDIAVADGRFTTLVEAVKKAGLVDALSGEGPLTVFAPTDDAFANLLTALDITAEELLDNPDLADILLYHVVGAALDGDAVAAESHIETLLEKDVDVEVVGDDLFINSAKVILGNIEASNGIIHVIDAVLLPPTLPSIPEIAVADGRFTTLVAALGETGLDEALSGEGPFTVFAPTDEAFGILLGELGISAEQLLGSEDLSEVLLYHVVNGRLKAEDVIQEDSLTTLLGKDVEVNVTEDGVFINNSEILITDIKAENGIIHVIDTVLVPEELPNIVEVAEGAGNFTVLLGALQLTGLDEALEGEGPFTVFAPTDEAFARLPSWLLNFLIDNPKYLERVLLYHVVAGDLDSGDVLSESRLSTLLGQQVHIRNWYGNVYINWSKLIGADIKASNGTVHVIDRVLIPSLWY